MCVMSKSLDCDAEKRRERFPAMTIQNRGIVILLQKESGKRSPAKGVTKKVTEASEKVTKKWPKIRRLANRNL